MPFWAHLEGWAQKGDDGMPSMKSLFGNNTNQFRKLYLFRLVSVLARPSHNEEHYGTLDVTQRIYEPLYNTTAAAAGFQQGVERKTTKSHLFVGGMVKTLLVANPS